ncbi:MAG: hypothetical protein JRN20_00615 [Nitrososphaerota archaeon]|jgi:hypothetical protein|nr:hypothetical protein [Nitrososphaerota archaeon]MDG6922148.1 hypothetical protein [Nitrososphaerota archaeon]
MVLNKNPSAAQLSTFEADILGLLVFFDQFITIDTLTATKALRAKYHTSSGHRK